LFEKRKRLMTDWAVYCETGNRSAIAGGAHLAS
jgi:rhodanese-related sulfurtransferase